MMAKDKQDDDSKSTKRESSSVNDVRGESSKEQKSQEPSTDPSNDPTSNDPTSNDPTSNDPTSNDPTSNDPSRRDLLSATSGIAMAGGLIASYGTFAVIAGRFLYSSDEPEDEWMYVAHTADVPLGKPFSYTAPSGAKIVLARQKKNGEDDTFIALSSVCPHLGCRVHWEPQNDRFFCPCHSAVFTKTGDPVTGPPAQASPPQPLTRFPVNVEDEMIFIKVPVYSFVKADQDQSPSIDIQEA